MDISGKGFLVSVLFFLIAGTHVIFPGNTLSQVHLWTFGNEVSENDGDIEFYQTWENVEGDFDVHDITYSSDNLHVKGWILEPLGPGPHPVLIWNRGGSGPNGNVKWHQPDGDDMFYKRELFPYVKEGYVVVCTQYRYNGRKVTVEDTPGYIPIDPPTESDYKSGADPVIEHNDQDYRGGIEVNDVINLLPLLQKMATPNGNGGLAINLDLSRIAMMGMSRGGMETYIALRELSDDDKYGELPPVQCAIVKGAISHHPDWLKDIADEKTVFHEVYPSNMTVPRSLAAKIAGNFDWTADDYYQGGSAHYITEFFPDADNFPVWDDENMENDDWPESGLKTPPDYPYQEIYSEEYYYRSAFLWDSFWAENDIPLLILHGKGDTQILWQDAQDMYNKITTVGDSYLYSLELFEDSDNNCSACDFLWSPMAKKMHCDHWLMAYDYGRGEVLPWLEEHLNGSKGTDFGNSGGGCFCNALTN